MQVRTRRSLGLGIAVALIIAGTLATGLLPPTFLYQVLAGGIIVTGFAVGYLSLGTFDFLEVE